MNDQKKIKIAFVSPNDVTDGKALSGSTHRCEELLGEHCGQVTIIHNFRPRKMTWGYLAKNLFRLFTWIYIFQKMKEIFWTRLGRAFVWEKTPLVSRYYGRMIIKQLKGGSHDVIFSDKGSFCIAHLDTKLPIIYATDTTFKAMENYYPEFMKPAKSFSQGGNLCESLALKKAAHIITTSQWSADSMVRDYGVSPEKISILMYATGFEPVPPKEAVLKEKSRDMCELLFIGVDWVRKGGDLAVDAVNWLNQNGICSKLIVCGCDLPGGHRKNEFIEHLGFIDRNSMAGRQRFQELFLSSHFFILPTRAECLGQVFCEAAAYALPCIATDTGGVSSAVIPGHNGVLLDINATGCEYGKVIKDVWCDSEKYQSLCVNAREIFEQRFSENVWVEGVNSIIERTLLHKRNLRPYSSS